MNNRIRRLYLAITDNKVIYITTNLAEFIRILKDVDPNIKSLSYYEKAFKEQELIDHLTAERGVMTLQKIENY